MHTIGHHSKLVFAQEDALYLHIQADEVKHLYFFALFVFILLMMSDSVSTEELFVLLSAV